MSELEKAAASLQQALDEAVRLDREREKREAKTVKELRAELSDIMDLLEPHIGLAEDGDGPESYYDCAKRIIAEHEAANRYEGEDQPAHEGKALRKPRGPI